MSARDLERLDHTADDFADDFAGDACPEQEQAREDSPDGGDTTRARSITPCSSTPGGRNGRPTPAAIEERRVRDMLDGTRGRVASSPIDPPINGTPGDGLHGPGHYWANAIDLLERAAVNLKTAAYRTPNHASATIGHREAEQVRMLLDRIRPEQHVIDTDGTKRSVA